MRNSSSISESPGKMGLPVAISAKIAPMDHVSTAHAYFLHPRRISGARYHSVTTYHAAFGARVSDATWTHKTSVHLEWGWVAIDAMQRMGPVLTNRRERRRPRASTIQMCNSQASESNSWWKARPSQSESRWNGQQF